MIAAVASLLVDTSGEMTAVTVFLLVPVIAWWVAGAVKRDD